MRRILLLIVLLGVAETSQAQGRWLQTVQIVAPVEDGHVTATLRDSLMHLFERGEVTARLEADGPRTSFQELARTLGREGLDFTSANQVFITYRLEATSRGFTSTILDLYYIYRPDGYGDIDYPVMYVEADQAAIRRLFQNSGTRTLINEAALEPFAEQMSFAQLSNGAIVSVGGHVIRDQDEGVRERARIMQTIRRFLY